MKTKVVSRVGKIRYFNCLPFYFGLEDALHNFDVTYLEKDPVGINQAMKEGEIDIAPISSLAVYEQSLETHWKPRWSW